MANKEVRALAKYLAVPFWKIADELGICEATVSRMLRKELNLEDKEKIIKAIKKNAKGE